MLALATFEFVDNTSQGKPTTAYKHYRLKRGEKLGGVAILLEGG